MRNSVLNSMREHPYILLQSDAGAISEVLSALSTAKINVASLNVARSSDTTSSNTPALCFMALDDDIPSPLLDQLKASPTLKSVSMIHF